MDQVKKLTNRKGGNYFGKRNLIEDVKVTVEDRRESRIQRQSEKSV